MRINDRQSTRLMSGALALALLLSSWASALPVPHEGTGSAETQNSPATAAPPDTQPLPDSPGAGRSAIANPTDDNEAGAPPAPDPPQSHPTSTQKPVGTAAAQTASTTGFAVARPAGAAMAPAKQRRVRTIVISVAAVVGAGVALGTVAALSRGTPSRPPGSQ